MATASKGAARAAGFIHRGIAVQAAEAKEWARCERFLKKCLAKVARPTLLSCHENFLIAERVTAGSRSQS
jgi:hypothetical protein